MAKRRRRKTKVLRAVEAGCSVCHNGQRQWEGKNAQGVAAKHHDATGHPTWVKVAMRIFYGKRIEDKRQANLFPRRRHARQG